MSLFNGRNNRKKTPTILQMEAVECGAAALAMVLAYHGRIEPLEKLRIECGVSRDGSKAINIIKVARKYGFEATGYRKEPESLRDIELPAILFWNFNHFVVLEGFKKNNVYINDPANGPRVVTFEELDQSFTGVVLTFTPGPDFQKAGRKRSIFSSLKRRLKRSSAALTYVILAGLFLVIPGLAIPVFTKIFVDSVLVNCMTGWIKPLLLAMGLAALLRAALTWLQGHYLLRFETKLALNSSAAFFLHVFRLPVEFFNQRMPGEIANRVILNDKVAQLLSGELAVNALNLVMILFYGILMLHYDVLLTVIGIATAVLNLSVLKYVSYKRTTLTQKLQQEAGKMVGFSMSGLQMIETLKATGAESDFFSQWSGYQAKVVNAMQQLGVTNQAVNVMPVLLSSLNTIAILGIGAIRVMDGHLSMGMLVAFQSLMASFLAPVTMMVNLGARLQETKADMERLDDVLNYEQDAIFQNDDRKDQSDDSIDSKLKGFISMNTITFGYSRLEAPLIEDFSLALKPGSRVALVGGSGSGKSTMARLLAGLYEPWSGEILFDNKPVKSIDRKYMCNSLAMVDQNIFMFQGSVRDNLCMWDNTISGADMIQAAEDACIHDDVVSRPGGYDSEVDEGGNNFSGGQCQRLEIARALTGNPSILIMDEATSALDSNTEMLVDDNIRRRGCTCLIIAHRLSTIRDCDEIIVLEHGKVVQRGTHDEMKDVEGGAYAELISAHA